MTSNHARVLDSFYLGTGNIRMQRQAQQKFKNTIYNLDFYRFHVKYLFTENTYNV